MGMDSLVKSIPFLADCFFFEISLFSDHKDHDEDGPCNNSNENQKEDR